VRHGGATQIRIRARFADTQMTLVIADNGRGMSRGQPRRGGGLQIMRCRAHTIGGDLEIGASASGGVEVRCTCPVESCDAS
jgi:signal transduction histidine kinase